MIIIPFGIIFVIVGSIIYRLNLNAARELEHRRITSRLADIERRNAAIAAGEAVEPSSRTRRVRSRR